MRWELQALSPEFQQAGILRSPGGLCRIFCYWVKNTIIIFILPEEGLVKETCHSPWLLLSPAPVPPPAQPTRVSWGTFRLPCRQRQGQARAGGGVWQKAGDAVRECGVAHHFGSERGGPHFLQREEAAEGRAGAHVGNNSCLG